MKIKNSYILILLLLALIACEDVYIADTDIIENVIVAEARIMIGNDENYIKLFKTNNFNDFDKSFLKLAGASVTVFNSNNTEYNLPEETQGIFKVDFELNPEMQYKIKIEYQGNSYESTFESAPEVPEIDSLYGIDEIKIIDEGGINSVSDFRERRGVQLYADMENETENQYFRFSGRKVLQYTYLYDVMRMGEIIQETMFVWDSNYPQEAFNIAAPPEYSSVKSIAKHPVIFVERAPAMHLGNIFFGWIVIMHQYGLSESAYNYYNDLNNQLNADGKIFDPLYVQARNNLKCTNDPSQLILGNFEVSSVKERRYYVKYNPTEKKYLIKPIPYFYYIPEDGKKPLIPPDFWEYESKDYP